MASSRVRDIPSEKRPRGRPRAKEPTQPVQVRLPQLVYDRYCRLARQTDQTLAGLLQRILVRAAPPATVGPTTTLVLDEPSPLSIPARRVARSQYLGR